MTFSLSNFFYVNYETAYDIKKEVSHILTETGISLCLSAKLRPQGLIGYEYIHRPGQGIAGFHHLTASIDFILFHCHMYLKASLRCFLCVICLIPVWLRVFNSHCCSAPQTSIWPSWYGVQDDGSVGEPSASLPPSSSLSQLDMPPPYEAVSGGKTDSLYDYTPVCTGTEIIYCKIIKNM